jgi:hypothetical protein
MKQEQINYLKSLDPKSEYGTLQRVLLEDNLNVVPFESVLRYLVENLMVEKETLFKENQKYVRILKQNGLYTSELILED